MKIFKCFIILIVLAFVSCKKETKTTDTIKTSDKDSTYVHKPVVANDSGYLPQDTTVKK